MAGMNDPVNHPSHYTSGSAECIDAITAALACHTNPIWAWLTGQIIKYLWRWPMKNGVEDLKKARWYLDRLIGETESKRSICSLYECDCDECSIPHTGTCRLAEEGE